MKYRFSSLFILTISVLFSIFLTSSTFRTNTVNFYLLRYDVEIQDKVVGWMTASKTVSPTDSKQTDFVIDSKVNINFIAAYEIIYKLESIYKNNELFKSNYNTKVNGDTQSYSNVRWDGSKYLGCDGKTNNTIGTTKIINSIGNLYYKEPVGLTQIFSEKFMTYCPIVKNGDYYTISFPDGKSSVYKYQNGICIWVESKQKLYKIVFRLKEIK